MAVVGVVAGMVALPSTATPTHACTATIGLTGGITNKLMAKVITHQSADW
jgi:hypothetical protein